MCLPLYSDCVLLTPEEVAAQEKATMKACLTGKEAVAVLSGDALTYEFKHWMRWGETTDGT